MYCKLLAQKQKKPLFFRDEYKVRELVDKNLQKPEALFIVEAYQRRRANEKGFNSEHFVLDLKRYLRYHLLREKGKKLSCSQIRTSYIYEPLRTKVQERLLKRYFYFPNRLCQDEGHQKLAYLIPHKNKVVRFYHERPKAFLYDKLMGVSEADIIKACGNKLLTVNSSNIAGEPMDVMERALPLTEAFAYLRKIGKEKIIQEINEVKKSNILITDFIEDQDRNIGLAVRLNRFGRKRVYVVAFDLELSIKYITRENDQAVIDRMQLECSKLKPESLSYGRLVRYLPQLKALPIIWE